MLLLLPRRSLLKSWQLKFEVIWFWLISPSGTMGRGQTLEDLGGKWEGVKSGFDTVCLLPTNLEVDEEKDLGQCVTFFGMLAECICMFNWKPLNPVLLLFMYSAHSAQFQINLFIFRFANFFTAITWHWQPCWIPQLQRDFRVYWIPINWYTTLHSNYSSRYHGCRVHSYLDSEFQNLAHTFSTD